MSWQDCGNDSNTQSRDHLCGLLRGDVARRVGAPFAKWGGKPRPDLNRVSRGRKAFSCGICTGEYCEALNAKIEHSR